MTKLETLKNSPTPADLRESVQQLSKLMQDTSEKLESTVAQIRSLEQLPDLVAGQVTQSLQALTPVLEMRQDLQTTLDSVGTIAALQRDTLEQLGQELASKATLNMESKVEALESSLSAMQTASEGLQALSETLTSSATDAANQIRSEARALTKAAREIRPSPWMVLGQMVGAALLAALVVVAGQGALSKLTRLDLIKAYEQANAAERAELLSRIVSRPAK
jgi:uncharacterized phage infection (PIP) family protein YhgE